MGVITLPKLRLAQLQSFTENTLTITADIAELATQRADVQTAFDTFVIGMTKDGAASNKKTLDKTRDLYNSGFFKNLEAERLFPHDEATSQLLAAVDKTVSKFGYGINRLSYDEQSATTDNMLSELGAYDLSAVPGLQRWLAVMQNANDAFKSTVQTYIEEKTATKSIEAAYNASEPLVAALEKLFTILYAHVQITATAPIINAYQELETLVESYK